MVHVRLGRQRPFDLADAAAAVQPFDQQVQAVAVAGIRRDIGGHVRLVVVSDAGAVRHYRGRTVVRHAHGRMKTRSFIT